MSTLIIEGPLEQLPVREDGSPYPFSLTQQNQAIFADTRTELTGHLIEGYANLPGGEEGDTEALYIRYQSAVAVANALQPVLAGDATNNGTFDPSVESEDTLTALFADRSEKIDDVGSWDHEVPLVLVATDFAPYTSAPKPEGNVLLVNPYTETTYLDSLSELGVVELFVNAE
ncbi:hypothetical protein [Arthrobacter sp. H14]|uniref:hypothetical protein n=1 Tax=Arthrobacter sp. H14 TaxID=1312959 RepID=UPI00047932E1|nr:hypothetical protein [Arthrobacter sp. H14]